MRILVTGGSGLIGSRLVYRLLEIGHEPLLLSRDPQNAVEKLAVPCEAYAWDPEAGTLPDGALENLDAVIHLAGESVSEHRWNLEIKRKIRNSRVQSTRHLVDALIRKKGKAPSVFISASGTGYYGNRGEEILTESSAPGKGFLADVSIAWEKETARACEIAPNIRCVSLRIGVVLAREGGALNRLLPIFRSSLGGVIGKGQQWMSWIHIDDVVEIIVEALINPRLNGAINTVAPHPVRNTDFTRVLGHSLDRPAKLTAPTLAVRTAFGEMADMVIASQRAIPTQLTASGFNFRYPHLAQALADIFPDWFREGCHEFVTRQWISQPVEEVFPFFSDAANLEAITPAWLNFCVVRKSTESVANGTLIDYRLKLRGVPLRWQSKIDEWIPNKKFVDFQTRGPYARWHHTHLFTPVRGGTLLTDRVIFRVPFGNLGNLVAGRYVRSDVQKIFEYRKGKISEIFSPGSIRNTPVQSDFQAENH